MTVIRALTQQLMKNGPEIHSQTLSGAGRILWIRDEGTNEAKGVKNTTRKPTESTNLAQGLIETEGTAREHVWGTYVTAVHPWWSGVTPKVGTGSVSDFGSLSPNMAALFSLNRRCT